MLLQRTVDTFIEKATDELYQFLNTPAFKDNMFLNTQKMTRFGIPDALKSRIEDAVKTWQQTHIEKILFETVLRILGEKFQAIHAKLDDIKNEMRGIETKYSALPKIARALVSSVNVSGPGLIGSLMVSHFLGNQGVSKIVAALSIGGGIVLTGVVAFDVLDNYDTIRGMSFETLLNTLSKEKLEKNIRGIYKEKIKNIIKTFLEDELKKEITNLNKSIDTMQNELDIYTQDINTLSSLYCEILRFAEKLNCIASLEIK